MQSPVILLYFLLSLSHLLWLSICITIVHTIDEILSGGGPIWTYLERITKVPEVVLFPGYFLFQLLNCGLALAGFIDYPSLLIILIVIRLVDFLVTHTILPTLDEPNPGMTTRWLLLIDAASLLFYSLS